jgi:hypothetical protein
MAAAVIGSQAPPDDIDAIAEHIDRHILSWKKTPGGARPPGATR